MRGCLDCGKQLAGHEIKDHYMHCTSKVPRAGRPRTQPVPLPSVHTKEPKGMEMEEFKPPETISLDLIKRIAAGEFPKSSEAESWGFTCEICEDVQTFNGSVSHIFPICDNCKSDLKEIILIKRKNNGKNEKPV